MKIKTTGPSRAEGNRTVEVATFAAGADVRLEIDGEVSIEGKRVTRLGGWLRLVTDDARMPATLRFIRAHVTVKVAEDGSSRIFVDRIRVGDVVWDDVQEFHDVFKGAWSLHLREATRRALAQPSEE